MGRPRKTPSPLELETKQILGEPAKTTLGLREHVAAILLSGLLSRGTGFIGDYQFLELKKTSYEYADKFLEN